MEWREERARPLPSPCHQVHRTFPHHFRDLWDEWLTEAREVVEEQVAVRDKVQEEFIVALLKVTAPQHMTPHTHGCVVVEIVTHGPCWAVTKRERHMLRRFAHWPLCSHSLSLSPNYSDRVGTVHTPAFLDRVGTVHTPAFLDRVGTVHTHALAREPEVLVGPAGVGPGGLGRSAVELRRPE